MNIKTKGIIFRSHKYGETSLIVEIYTETHGIQKYIVNGARKSKSRLPASILQVMSIVDIVAKYRSDKDLNRLLEVRPSYIYQQIPFDIRKGSIGLFMIEIARKTIRESEENQPLFNFLFNQFVALDQTENSIANNHLWFLVHLSSFLGFAPGGVFSTKTPYFNLRDGIFEESYVAHSKCLPPEQAAILSQLVNIDISDVSKLKMKVEVRRELLKNLIDYFRYHVESLSTINSHQILRDVLE
ncbi:MAG: DNA repair protein RecO [Bacteroidota bacterium]